MSSARTRRSHVRSLGAECRKGSVIGDWNGWGHDEDGLAPRPDGSGIWEGSGRPPNAGRPTSIGSPRRWTAKRRQGRPIGFHPSAPATGSRVWSLEWQWQDGGGWIRVPGERPRRADVHLRGAPGLLAARGRTAAQLPRSRAGARRLHAAHGLHARRVDADHRAPVLRVLGLPDHRIFRPDRALRHAAGLHVLRSIICISKASA